MSDEEPVWMVTARREIGVKEVAGGADHPRILQYLRTCRWVPAQLHDEVPWCAAFVCFVLEQADIPSTRSAAARSYIDYGKELKAPQPGCIVVLTRDAHPGAGHVGFYVGEVADKVLILGGNQNNQVCVKPYPKGRAISYRWPLV